MSQELPSQGSSSSKDVTHSRANAADPRLQELRTRLAKVSVAIAEPSGPTRKTIDKLEQLLVRSRIDALDELVALSLSVERASWYDPQSLSAERQKHLDRLVEQLEIPAAPEFRVFRREAPLAAPGLAPGSPAWGRGAAIDQTVGPFSGIDGRQFWFDFYRIERLVPLYLDGDAEPAFLFYVSEIQSSRGVPARIDELLHILKDHYRLSGSSVWIRADLLASEAPSTTYVGLKIRGGEVRFSKHPIDAVGKLTLPAGANCSILMELAEAVPAPQSSMMSSGTVNAAGGDATQASIRAPDNVSLKLTSAGATVTQIGAASAQVYEQHIDFAWQAGSVPHYEEALQSVVVPLEAPAQQFTPGPVQSPFATLAGETGISKAGWILPVTAIDVDAPTEAAGPGNLAIQTAAGLKLTWRGLRDGPIDLPSPWIAIAPGLILIADPNASGRYANQRFRLWKDEDTRFRSELSLRYTDSFPVIYVTSSTGAEAVLTATNAEAKLDRPVDVGGTPFPVRTLDSRMLLAYTDDRAWVFFYEDNILVDSLNPEASWPVAPGEAVSLAIRNALFTITPVNSLLLFAELQDEEMVERGVVLLGMGLYGLLPTLPDPYAASVSWLKNRTRTHQRVRETTLLLVASVIWTKAAEDGDPDAVETAFAIGLLGAQQETIDTWSAAALPSASAQPGGVVGVAANNSEVFASSGAQPQAATTSSAAPREPKPNQPDWDRHFFPFDREQFALLDVSSNADQMGVSFAWFNPREVEDESYIYYQIYKPLPGDPGTPGYPLQVRDLDLSAQSRFVRSFALPQISWEPLFNLTLPGNPNNGVDPPFGFNLYPDDGGPTRILNNSVELVPIAPIPVTEFMVEDFDNRPSGFTGALFTLPFGLRAFAEFSRQNQFDPALDPAQVRFNRPEYTRPEDLGGDLRGGIQLRVDAPDHSPESPTFKGGTLQLNNVLRSDGTPTGAGTLGGSVGFIFNREFYYDGIPPGFDDRGVPLERIDFSGYGASMFSHWENANAAIAATSKAYFDVFVGRTGHEVIQVRSLVYPWGIYVVRTITVFRVSSGHVYRFDSGWQADSDGIYDFRYNAYNPYPTVATQPNPYVFHPGIVRGVFQIRNIKETSDVSNFEAPWNKANGDIYVDREGEIQTVGPGTPSQERNLQVVLQPVYFDADVEIDNVVSGAKGGRVPSKGMLGYVQLAPSGEPIPPNMFADLLISQFGALGGPVDCVIDIAQSGQKMRLSRVDVNASTNGSGSPIFVSAARGAVILPKDGSWSVVQHSEGNGEVTPVDTAAPVPLIRRGILNSTTQTTNATANDLLRLANPADLLPAAQSPATRNYGLLQSTDTQKALFRKPSFRIGSDQLHTETPDFADAYRLLNSAGVFPNVQDTLPMALGSFETQIVEEGYRLLDQADPDAVLEQALPEGPLYLINEEFLKLYIEYAKKDKDGTTQQNGSLRFGFDSTASDLGRKWLSKVNDIGMVVDLGPLSRIMLIKGKFDTEKGAVPSFIEPELEFGDPLEPVVAILQILEQLQGGDYAGAFQKGLEIAMSNSADTWNYALQARKEIPVVKFPPGVAYNNPTNPLKLECHLAVGVYFNEALSIPNSPGQLIPSAGAYIEFGGSLSVMCVSVGGATVYAVGTVDLRVAADIKTGPSLQMRFGFGAEISVGLPVIGTVSVLYMVGVEIYLGTDDLSVTAFLLFRGRAEILGGIVTIQITIEASGTYKRLGSPEQTIMEAQFTFALDISIFLVINIHFSKGVHESRQIA